MSEISYFCYLAPPTVAESIHHCCKYQLCFAPLTGTQQHNDLKHTDIQTKLHINGFKTKMLMSCSGQIRAQSSIQQGICGWT